MDINTLLSQLNGSNITLITALITQKELLESLSLKLMGPTCDYVGESIKNFIEKRSINISNIMLKATKKLGDKINTKGQVNPRILKEVVEEGSYVEEEIVAEYFSGILASSRCLDGKDDRGLSILSLLKGMSACDILIHNVLYKTIKKEYSNMNYHIGDPTDRIKMKIFVPYIELVKILNNVNINCDYQTAIEDTLYLLSQYKLIDQVWLLAPGEIISKNTNGKAIVDGLYFTPSALGAKLLLWAYGYGNIPNSEFFNSNIIFEDEQNIEEINNVVRLLD